MIDDMQGLYSHASDAYRAGKREGREELYRAVMLALSTISAAHERWSDTGFKVAEECCKAVRLAKEAADAPKKTV
jgi:hypothetical protein